ncbi:MAG: biotin/lipoate A/B protein ligase family protein [Promethearchaeota archaeon]
MPRPRLKASIDIRVGLEVRNGRVSMAWRIIEKGNQDIFTNLAVEEALARVNAKLENKMNTLRFWRASSAVVMGRFQCVHKEADIQFCKEHSIPIARRFTGGGTVYQDSGNLNFSICADQKKPYVKRTLPELYEVFIGGIARGLQEIGISARFDPFRSCIRIGRKKITGTAGWVKQGVSFIHGTLLIDSNLETLQRCLHVPEGQPAYLRDGKIRCMESKRDIVTSIQREVAGCPSNARIKSSIVRSIERIAGTSAEEGELTEEEERMAQSLYQSRYSQAKWNMGTPVPENGSR